MEFLLPAAGVVVIALIALLIAYITFRRAYRVAAPNEALVITGRSPSKGKGGDIDLESGTRIVVGGRAFVRPLFDRAHSVSLSSRQIEVGVESQSKDGIFLSLQAVAQIKIGEEVGDIRKAAQRFLDQQDEIDRYSREILSGSLRAVVGTLPVVSIVHDREAVAQTVRTAAVDSLNNQGLVIDTLQIISVADDSDYLRNLGRPAAAEKEREARIAESQTRRESTEAENADNQKIADSQKELDLRNAAIAKETADERAEAKAAEELAYARQRQRVLDENQKIADQENELRERELVREVRKPADAEQYASERKADSERYTREQESQASLVEAQNNAEAVKASGQADADSTRAKGEAEAASVRASAEAYKQFNEAAVLSQVLESLPQIAKEIAAPMSNIESLSIISSDGDNRLPENVATGIANTMKTLQATTGMDVQGLINQAIGGKNGEGLLSALQDTGVGDQSQASAEEGKSPSFSGSADTSD